MPAAIYWKVVMESLTRKKEKVPLNAYFSFIRPKKKPTKNEYKNFYLCYVYLAALHIEYLKA